MTLVKKWRGAGDVFPSAFSSWIEDFFNESNLPRWSGLSGQPAVNIRETDKSFVLEVAAPGYKKEDFSVTVENDLLTISCNQENKVEESEKGYTRQEFSYSSFSRSFTLPDSVNADNIKGSYNNGILTIELPKKPEAAKVRKTVKVS
ncbi:MAG TPA: Hsp20/alpha crystallin family protein [Chitinophagales bacterium]|nr:Hsp20/alpha crystallin family protein [Chitinophagales bacterium]